MNHCHTIKKLISFAILSLFLNAQIGAQQHTLIRPLVERYGVDRQHKIIVWNFDQTKDLDSVSRDSVIVVFKEKYTFKTVLDSLSFKKRNVVRHNDEDFKLFITELPVIKIYADTITDEPKRISSFSFADHDTIIKALAGIEYRGNISLKFPKKTFDLEFWQDDLGKKSKDLQLKNLREDDDWILDGLYNEPLRLRSYISNKLWLSIRSLHYSDLEKEAKSGIDLHYVEVFLNDKYVGVYALMEQVDRKLLELKKHEKSKIRGELFKASSYEGAPSYKKVTKYNNLFPHWSGYEIEYPFINYKAQWRNIYRYTKFVISSKDSTFKKRIRKKFDLDNAIDYYLFINLIRATDNLGKNFYVARYDKKTPYFNVPWDLDGVLGTIQDGKRIETTDDILTNGLFERLLKLNPEKYKSRLKERWLLLRDHQFNDESLFGQIQRQYDYFQSYKIYEREQMIWPSEISASDHLMYLNSWLKNRLKYMDAYIKKL